MEVIAVIRDHLQSNENVKPNTAFLEELKNKLPEFFNDEGFDIEKFQNALKENDVNEFSEGYQLNFIGKDYARKQAGDAPTSVIVPDNEHNQKEENKNSKNLFFTGDNLEVLRHLRNNYSNKIDVIYIDPPYNTGKDDFVYPDKFEYSNKQLKEVFGMSDDDVSKLDALKGSKSHSAWLTFMYPRLWLAKQLLADDGVIFVSIGEDEHANMKLLLDEVFGERSYLTEFIWEKTQHFGRQKINYYSNADYILTYCKRGNGEKLVEYQKKEFTDAPLFNDSNNEKELVFPSGAVKFFIKDDIYKKSTNDKYELLKPVNVKNGKNQNELILKFKSRWSQNTIDTGVKNGTTFLVKSEAFAIRAEYSDNKVSNESPKQIIFTNKNNKYMAKSRFNKQVGTNENASSELESLIGKKIFSYPKPVGLVAYLISLVMKNNHFTDELTILDFFAGSSTTADAVMQLNAEDGGKRKFIMVQLPEKTYEVDKNGNKKPTKGGKAAFDAGYMSIDEISRERIKRAAKKIKDENPDLDENFDGGFKHYRVVSSQKETLDKIYDFDPENYELVSDMIDSFSSAALGVPGNASGEDTILTTWLAEDGYDFNTDDLVEYDFAGYKALGIKDTRLYLIDGNLHSEQIKELLNQLGTNKVKFQSIVVYGYSFNVMDMKELERGLSQLNSKVNLIKRY